MRVELTTAIRLLDETMEVPEYKTEGSVAFDFQARIGVQIMPGKVELVPTGVVMEVPMGYALLVFARSSTPVRRGLLLANGVGIIDRDYCGPNDEIKLPMLNFTDQPVWLESKDRFAQGMLIEVPFVRFEVFTALNQKNRGGFGSTGAR